MSASAGSASTAAPGRSRRARFRLLRAAHPEWWVAALAVLGWSALAVDHVVDHGRPGSDAGSTLGAWLLMIVAMMTPLVIDEVRDVALGGWWERRHHTAALFVAGFVATWVVFGVAGAQGFAFIEWVTDRSIVGNGLAAAWFGVAAVWQLNGRRARALRACHLRSEIALGGRRLVTTATRAGAISGGRCVAVCWPAMAAMVVAAHAVHLMAPVAAVMAYDRWARRPDPRIGAATFASIAVVLAL